MCKSRIFQEKFSKGNILKHSLTHSCAKIKIEDWKFCFVFFLVCLFFCYKWKIYNKVPKFRKISFKNVSKSKKSSNILGIIKSNWNIDKKKRSGLSTLHTLFGILEQFWLFLMWFWVPERPWMCAVFAILEQLWKWIFHHFYTFQKAETVVELETLTTANVSGCFVVSF